MSNLKEGFRNKLLSYITAAFGLVAGLAWNDAIKSLIEYFFPLEKNTILLKFIYAILITLVFVFVTLYLLKIFEKKEKDD
ncbi:MAG: hypothetical protein COV79_02840 [Parcubacteria group bacterium CG11_big_fil_rev_8_21_14_0_20_41_14]|nr:MAG: hypothetical protein COV79_02840 [Parcubacteria group bacterium CG11_big_fil_rev_8_21_14_0_20_41_14]